MSTEGYFGTQTPESRNSEFNAVEFVITQLLNKRNYTTLVQVMAVRSAGEVAQVGFVDVQIMLNQIDAAGNSMPHGIVNNVPYFRLQGGANAIIIDPQVGDIGMATFADRDISSVKANRAISNPGSKRRADIADGLYTGGFLNGIPTQYVRFSADGIQIHSPIAILMDAPKIELRAPVVEINASTSTTITTPQFKVVGASTLDGPVEMTSTATAATSVTAPLISGTTQVKFAGKDSTSHTHRGVRAGTDNSGPPT